MLYIKKQQHQYKKRLGTIRKRKFMVRIGGKRIFWNNLNGNRKFYPLGTPLAAPLIYPITRGKIQRDHYKDQFNQTGNQYYCKTELKSIVSPSCALISTSTISLSNFRHSAGAFRRKSLKMNAKGQQTQKKASIWTIPNYRVAFLKRPPKLSLSTKRRHERTEKESL